MKLRHHIAGWSLLVLALAAPIAYAATCALKTWSQGDVVQTTDLNSNFSCINTATPAGTPIVDATVAVGANINYTKLNLPTLMPQAWAALHTKCTSGTCATTAKARVTSVTHSGTGLYGVTLSYVPGDNNYMVQAAALNEPTYTCQVDPSSLSAGSFSIKCKDASSVSQDSEFSFVVFDDQAN